MTNINKNGILVDAVTGDTTGVPRSDGSEKVFAVIGENGTPVNGVKATLTSDMTNANADVTLTAVNYGIEGNEINVTYVNPAGASKALSVVVTGTNIVVNLATGSNSAITSTATQVAAALAANAAAALIVVATAQGSGAGVVNALAKAYLAGGVTVTPGHFMVQADGLVFYVKTGAQTWGAITLDVAG